MKNFIKKYITQILVVCAVLLFLELTFAIVLNYVPFKKANLLISDLYYVYTPFFYYMRNVLLTGRSLFNSFSFSLGQSMIGIIAYFCLSPLNLIFLFSKLNNIDYFVKILFFLKIILCGLNMSIYLNEKTDKFYNVIFSTIFALITFNLKYAFNLMWLDVIFMLPLVILGLEKMIEGKSNKLYVITLAIMIFTNFYIAFGACLFVIIYFFYYSLIKNKLTFKLFWKFVYSSLIAALLDAFMLLPTIYNMLDGKALNAANTYGKLFLYNPRDVIYNFTPGGTAGHVLNDLPYFYSSTLVLVLFVNYLFNDNISYKEKWLSFFIVIFMIFATLLGPIDLIFHCFRVPNSLYYRYIYILPFFLISTVTRSKIKISWLSLIPIALIITWALLVEFSVKMIIFAALMILYFVMIKTKLKFILLFLVVFELFYNSMSCLEMYNGFENYDIFAKYDNLLEGYYPKENEFYRIEVENPITFNDSFILGYYGLDSFTPTISHGAQIFLKDYLLMARKSNLNYVYQNRFVLDPYFLNVKYELVDDEVKENEYLLPLIIKTDNFDYFKPTELLIENANNLYKMINGEYLFKEIDFEIDCIKNNVVVNKHCNVSYEHKDGYSYYVEIYTKYGRVIYGDDYLEDNTIFEIDDSFDLDYEDITVEIIKLYEYDKNIIKTQENNFEVFRDEYMRLKVDKGLYIMTVPYDESWHVRINGKEVEKIKVLDSLIGFEVEEGTLEIEFIPQGLIPGMIISVLTSSIIFVYYIRKRLI